MADVVQSPRVAACVLVLLYFNRRRITWIERVFWLVDSYQDTFANRSYVEYELTQQEKVGENCFCAVYTHQLKFANTSLPTLVCRVKAALDHITKHLEVR